MCKSLDPLLLLHDTPPSDSFDEDDSTIPLPTTTEPASMEATPVVLHAFIGDSNPHLLHLQGTIGDTILQVLVDSDATPNFIHPMWLPLLHLQ